MTDRPPDLDVLADLDAGVLDASTAERVRAAALADPRSASVLDALAATRAELAAHPAPAVPAEISRRWAAALEAEATPTAAAGEVRPTKRSRTRSRPPGRSGALRPAARRRRPALVAGILFAALIAAAGIWRPADPGPIDLAALARTALNTRDIGALADPAHRAGCLAAVDPPGVAPDALLLGGLPVELDGRAGVLLVLATGELGVFDVVVVDPACGPEGGHLLASQRAGW
ncbi:hypothetical protein [Pseudonocardia nigra]|uniref:hypothetical protein n=1 Tax=Pseudonocardia nigra TaxID=1921578 RepID=UPI001C603BA5|nr:hypothetical protein [Pseudonocardia nigra]